MPRSSAPKKPRVKRHVWTSDEESALIAEYAMTSTPALATRFGLTESQVYSKAFELGLKKSREYLSAVHGPRAIQAGAPYRFKAGGPAWNKGLHYTPGGKVAEGWFKPGHRPHTWMPVGSHRITKDGILQRKVADLPGPPNVRWRSVHELVWIAAHGPVPKGFVIVFKAGRKTTVPDEITVERIECVTRAQLMVRSSTHRHGPEIARLTQLKGAITRQINKRKREAANAGQ